MVLFRKCIQFKNIDGKRAFRNYVTPKSIFFAAPTHPPVTPRIVLTPNPLMRYVTKSIQFFSKDYIFLKIMQRIDEL